VDKELLCEPAKFSVCRLVAPKNDLAPIVEGTLGFVSAAAGYYESPGRVPFCCRR